MNVYACACVCVCVCRAGTYGSLNFISEFILSQRNFSIVRLITVIVITGGGCVWCCEVNCTRKMDWQRCIYKMFRHPPYGHVIKLRMCDACRALPARDFRPGYLSLETFVLFAQAPDEGN